MKSIVRLIIYSVLLAINGIMFYFLHSHFYYMLLVVMVVAPVISLAGGVILRHFVSVSIVAKSEGSGRQGEEAYFEIEVKNPSFLISLDARLYMTVENVFFGTKGTQTIAIPIRAKSGYKFDLPLVSSYSGLLQVDISEIQIFDLMGFFGFKKKVEKSAQMVILPKVVNLPDQVLPNFEYGTLESEESKKRGHDFSDVQEIREYIPGDRLMSIHWKLSAKRDILMVKDRMSMSDKQLVILPELCNRNKPMLALVLSMTYSLIMKMIEDHTTVRLMYWSVDKYQYEDTRIDYIEDATDAFSKMFYEKTYDEYELGASRMALVHPEMKAYIQVIPTPERALVQVRENG